MINSSKIITIKTWEGNYIGKVKHQDETRIKLMDVCIMTYKKQGNMITVNLKKIEGAPIFYGMMIVFEINDDSELFKAYTRAISGLIIMDG